MNFWDDFSEWRLQDDDTEKNRLYQSLEKRLEELSSELRAEKGNMDVYIKGEEPAETAGIYQVKQGICMKQEG